MRARWGSSAVSITGGKRGREQTVPSTSLKDFFQQNSLARADFIKIDIEGGEVEVRNSSAPLKSVQARLIVEPHFVDGSLSTSDAAATWRQPGFRVDVRGKIGESEPLIEATP